MGQIRTTEQAERIRVALLTGMRGDAIRSMLGFRRDYERRALDHGDKIHNRRYWEDSQRRQQEYLEEARRDREAMEFWNKELHRKQFRIKRRRQSLVTRRAGR